ncbi:MAG: VOC family protein [Pseudomonadota bacterium]|nr:VOC family protein [Pseudomonadota bacterium]
MNNDINSAISLAHLRLVVCDLATAVEFFEALGGAADVRQDKFVVVALADDTRLQLIQSEDGVAAASSLQFDFRVGDIDAAWQSYADKGLNPGEIQRRRPGHDSFTVIGPDATEVKINGTYKRS